MEQSNLPRDKGKGNSSKPQKKAFSKDKEDNAQERGQVSSEKKKLPAKSGRSERQDEDDPWAGFPVYHTKKNKNYYFHYLSFHTLLLTT